MNLFITGGPGYAEYWDPETRTWTVASRWTRVLTDEEMIRLRDMGRHWDFEKGAPK